ncbi:MAG TPA: alpha-amylase family glycosyl hydrolase [Mycobacterium sp.]|uniref:alpha-amylase family glycosyl hydrolase n=1 Tax=Mycolicibacterium sp. TaxID=2320850 RepID=UPI0025E02186|nr:alpha-amylase family glycosyl hydrolase [Mycolicibacterium sp.]HPX36119.1 alpha-amylase family glycosyl hydrolase [Mycobacterium sp.]HQC75708.1 alpha-amylase family glycosyl hydrolase [Mycobacterium sp.]
MNGPDWVRHAIWWHVYPLGFVGAFPADPVPAAAEHRLSRIVDWLDHAVQLGASGIALGPVFASRTHGYDTTDHHHIDPRLGDDADFDRLIEEAHRRGLRVLLDGVFNHVGTDFPRYREALEDDPDARSWFHGRPGRFHTFEGHPDLITLNHRNPAVADYVAEVMSHWLSRGADGWRLDAAYAVPGEFWDRVLPRVRETHPDAWFVAEVIHGDYPAFVAESGVDSVTQYELWKAIWSSLNDGNFHELDWALQRHNGFQDTFAPLTFVGNHDVTRIASRLNRAEHLAQALVLLFTVGGVPSVYAGDEFGYAGVKEDRAGGDDAVRPEFGPPGEYGDIDVLNLHRYLIGLRRRHPWLFEARSTALLLENTRYVYESRCGDDALIVALNLSDESMSVPVADLTGRPAEIVAGSGAPPSELLSRAEVPAHGWAILKPT